MDEVALLVAQQLHANLVGWQQRSFQIDVIVAKHRFGFGAGPLNGRM